MSEPRQPVIVGGARTPVGRLLGSLASKSATELGGLAIAGALDLAGIGPDRIQYVTMGHVLQAGAGADHRPAGRRRGGHRRREPGRVAAAAGPWLK